MVVIVVGMGVFPKVSSVANYYYYYYYYYWYYHSYYYLCYCFCYQSYFYDFLICFYFVIFFSFFSLANDQILRIIRKINLCSICFFIFIRIKYIDIFIQEYCILLFLSLYFLYNNLCCCCYYGCWLPAVLLLLM